jgi:hypothetical protein
MTVIELESSIYVSAHTRDYETLNTLIEDLRSRIFKLDRWFDMFLDRFDEKLSECDRSDPVKKLYNTKFDEYSKIKQLIVVAENYMKKHV